MREGFYLSTGLVGLNLLLFSLSSGLFLDFVHHHWVLPWTSTVLALQWVAAAWGLKKKPALSRTAGNTLLGLLLFACLVAAARYETILTCDQHCGPKLALMVGVAAGVFLASSFKYQRTGPFALALRILAGILLAASITLVVLNYR